MTDRKKGYERVLSLEGPKLNDGLGEVNVLDSQEMIPGGFREDSYTEMDVSVVLDLLLDNISRGVMHDMEAIGRHFDLLYAAILKVDSGLNSERHDLFAKQWAQALLFVKAGIDIGEFSEEEFADWYTGYFPDSVRYILGDEFILGNPLARVNKKVASAINEIMREMLDDYPS